MKKLRTIKPIPGIPVGSVLKKDSCCDRYSGETPYNYSIEELEGFVEEIKEPKGFWYLESNGVVYETEGDSGVPGWLLFNTKDSAEKFAKVLKDTHPHTFHGSCREFYELCEALNDRVK